VLKHSALTTYVSLRAERFPEKKIAESGKFSGNPDFEGIRKKIGGFPEESGNSRKKRKSRKEKVKYGKKAEKNGKGRKDQEFL
jgi:hypothetical protein